jgi:hypothetical protein
MKMQVERRAALHQVGVFNDEKASARLAGRNLKKYLTVPARMRLAKAILTRAYNMSWFRSRSRCGMCKGQAPQPCGGQQCC